MIDWWGPVLYEYYAGTEGNGSTFITSEDWLAHPGHRRRAANGVIHICDEAGTELPDRRGGPRLLRAGGGALRVPQRAPEKTADPRHPEHPTWTALGDVGYVDEDGYLYLTDRKAFMIISGGVNVYPQQVEDALVMHPKVADVAVFGIPNEDLGEEVKAVVEAAEGVETGDDLAAELTRLREGTARRLHGSEVHRLHRRDAAAAHGQALQAPAARPLPRPGRRRIV